MPVGNLSDNVSLESSKNYKLVVNFKDPPETRIFITLLSLSEILETDGLRVRKEGLTITSCTSKVKFYPR